MSDLPIINWRTQVRRMWKRGYRVDSISQRLSCNPELVKAQLSAWGMIEDDAPDLALMLTDWAVKRRGIDPAGRVLLWHLALHYDHEAGRSTVSQATLCAEIEISPATLNRQIKRLESAGFLEVIRERDGKTKRQKINSYRIVFKQNFSASQKCNQGERKLK